MSFPFRFVGDLLQSLDDALRGPIRQKIPSHVLVAQWFQKHRQRLDATDLNACAILSTLLPDRRTDRVFFIQSTKLEGIIGQALTLGSSRVKELRRYREPGLGIDLADCVQLLLNATPNVVHQDDIMVEAIDAILAQIASRCKFSSPAVRNVRTNATGWSTQAALGDIYRRLSPRDAKWFTRLVLKDYQTAALPHNLILMHYHPLLPQMLKIRDDLGLTTAFLRHARQSPDDYGHISSILKPKLGVKVGRQNWFKGRSIKHCVDMCRRRTISCEQKLDGEYCQIHIDLSKGRQCIQIFSKSGKDSTADRAGIRSAIRESLSLGSADCPIKHGCILEGELVVYSTKDHGILPFHKIRKHVSRSGVFLGTDNDSQPHSYEQLMIVYFDVLMIDNESMLPIKHSDRRKRLLEVVKCRPGAAELVTHEIISFSRSTAPGQLRNAFAACIVSRAEGLVLKPDESYFDFSTGRNPHIGGNIKLKKEYVQGWGDVGDFAVVGASYDAVKAKTYPSPPPRWTHFYIACLCNRVQVLAKNERPRFRHINVVELNNSLMRSFQTHCHPEEIPYDENKIFDIDPNGFGATERPTVLFSEPLVFDMRCFSFDKSSNTNFWSMRFPLVSKLHFDRSYLDTVSFEDLQRIAEDNTSMADQEDSQELCRWISALEGADPRGIAVDAVSSQSTSSDMCLTPSPVRRRIQKSNAVLETITEESAAGPSEPVRSVAPILFQLPTAPPRSSAAQIKACTETADQSGENLTSHTRKRAIESPFVEVVHKRSCKQGLEESKQDSESQTSSSHNNDQTASRARSPLSEVGINRSFYDHRPSQTYIQSEAHTLRGQSNIPLPELLLQNSHILKRPARISTHQMRQPKKSPRSQRLSHADRRQPFATHICSHSGAACALARCSILLSPCIASYPLVSETLLQSHGIDHWVTHPTQWAAGASQESVLGTADIATQRPSTCNTSALNSTAPAAVGPSGVIDHSGDGRPGVDNTSLGQRRRMRGLVLGPKVRKICFVESKRKEATVAFLAEIERANLRKTSPCSSPFHPSSATSSSSPYAQRGRRAGQSSPGAGAGEAARRRRRQRRQQQRREWIAVYDWRVLEVITDIETGKVPVPSSDPWRRFWVGLA